MNKNTEITILLLIFIIIVLSFVTCLISCSNKEDIQIIKQQTLNKEKSLPHNKPCVNVVPTCECKCKCESNSSKKEKSNLHRKGTDSPPEWWNINN